MGVKQECPVCWDSSMQGHILSPSGGQVFLQGWSSQYQYQLVNTQEKNLRNVNPMLRARRSLSLLPAHELLCVPATASTEAEVLTGLLVPPGTPPAVAGSVQRMLIEPQHHFLVAAGLGGFWQ